jgi:hypothetical protein
MTASAKHEVQVFFMSPVENHWCAKIRRKAMTPLAQLAFDNWGKDSDVATLCPSALSVWSLSLLNTLAVTHKPENVIANSIQQQARGLSGAT